MPKKDVCYITTEPNGSLLVKGQIVAIKEPNFQWTEIERGEKPSHRTDIKYAIKTLYISNDKLQFRKKPDQRLVVIKKNGKEFIDPQVFELPSEN